MAYSFKLLSFSLGGGESGFAGLTLSGLRARANITFPGGAGMSTAEVAIWGMTLDQMNAFATFGNVPTQTGKAKITINAGESGPRGSKMSEVFTGTINNAYPDFLGNAEAVMHMMCSGGIQPAVQKTQPTSFQGQVDGATVLEQVVKKAGYKFENNGAKAMLSNPYLHGTPREQIVSLIEAMGVEWNGMENGVVSIWPAGGNRQGGGSLISPQTGMIGYPGFTQNGIFVRTQYNANIRIGQTFQVQSDLKKANGTWKCYMITHTLDTKIPGGQWFSVVFGTQERFFAGPAL